MNTETAADLAADWLESEGQHRPHFRDSFNHAAAELRRLSVVEKERNAMAAAIGNQQLSAFIEKHGNPVPIVAERDALKALCLEMFEMSENWPGIAYAYDLDRRVREALGIGADAAT